ncbi:N,N'-diacetylbacillosaminyl-diphospho-undecaprenol alpha-1,3-N-acetylgalactosaminyltransferase [Campylobacter cuniculorum]|uniref:N, N'-diacetylbacillosaminyl-diphospho-undecaprenol alpha-1,3-N-acetylgalactosaminyltransferase n=1 Tax=Campylobacter cuniculorum TaxID=374106 RepID=UPI0023F052A5|nr:N,N'-diacetylbacillosaminyl-diphospho-undecaprenol alpha-1,3-N-acetylgalactosaminyltransferase [Campylobacter cuniculorum]
MKIGFLSHSGMSVYHFRMPIIRALEARGDEVFVIVPKDDYTLKLENLGLKLIIYELNRKSINPLVVFKNFLHLKKLLKTLNLDLIQTAAHKSNTFGVLAAKCAKIPYIFALVEGLGSFYISEDFKSKFVRLSINFLYKISFKIAHKLIFVNSSDAQFMRSLGLRNEKICIIKSVGVNLKKFFPIPIPLESKQEIFKEFQMPQKAIVLMIARALWHKGVKEFYEAAELLKDRANFVLIGGRDENPSCAPLEFLTSACVFYLGAREDIAYWLNLCDIFVLPSYKEGFPVTILEAKACAKACVVSDCEGCVEAVENGFDGLFSKTRDSKDLAQKIALLLEDENLRKNLAQNAFKNVLQYDENLIAQKYLQIYDEALKGN